MQSDFSLFAALFQNIVTLSVQRRRCADFCVFCSVYRSAISWKSCIFVGSAHCSVQNWVWCNGVIIRGWPRHISSLSYPALFHLSHYYDVLFFISLLELGLLSPDQGAFGLFHWKVKWKAQSFACSAAAETLTMRPNTWTTLKIVLADISDNNKEMAQRAPINPHIYPSKSKISTFF